MRLMSYNILKGGLGRLEAIADVIRFHQPDAVMLQEAYHEASVRELAQRLEFPHFAAQEGASVAFIAKEAIHHHQWHTTPRTRSPFLEVQFKNWRLFGVHLTAVFINYQERRRHQQLEDLLQIVKPHADQPHLLIGDFNAAAPNDAVDVGRMPRWLRVMIALNGGVPREALAYLTHQAGYQDVFRHFHPGEAGFTLPPPTPNSRLDYCFTLPVFLPSFRACHPIYEPEAVKMASDHFPIFAEFGD